MAVGRSILETIEMLPVVMQEWIKSLFPVGECAEIDVSRDCDILVSDGGYKSHITNGYLKVKVTIPPLEHCCTFAQIHPGEWIKADENTDISYISKYETVIQKEELNDKDAFDLMDSIREELWK